METWRSIPSFPGYSVSDLGFVRNDLTIRYLQFQKNKTGTVYVGLTKDHEQHNRAVARLVAEIFLEPSPFEAFNTPINLNGDRENNSIENLMWRPRWFAVKYHQQFFVDSWEATPSVIEVETGKMFNSILDAVICYGLMGRNIYDAASLYTYARLSDARVWPTGQKFKFRETHTYTRANRGV